MKGFLRIGQVSKLSGLSIRTIDYYTQCDLLPVRRSSSNYRLYPESVLETLKRIKGLKQQRMTISEIKRVIQFPEDQELQPIINEVQDKMIFLQKNLGNLEEKLKDIPVEEKKLIYKNIESKLLEVKKILS